MSYTRALMGGLSLDKTRQDTDCRSMEAGAKLASKDSGYRLFDISVFPTSAHLPH